MQIDYYDSNNVSQTTTLIAGTIIETNHDFTDSTPYILTANEYIRVKDKNAYSLTSGSKYLAILNRSGNIVLQSEDYIILQENEYFIYPNTTKTDLVILGMGTKLSNPNIDKEITIINNTERIDDINKNNIDNLGWSELQADLLTTETTIISLGQNVSVKIDETEYISNTEQELNEGNKLYYKNVGDSQYSIIESNSVQKYYIRSRLNINATTTKPQELYENQSITLLFTDSSNNKIKGTETGDSYESTYIQFNSNIVMAGGENIDMGSITTDINGNISTEYKLKAYNYNIDEEYILKRDGNSLNLPKFEGSTIQFKNNISLPSQKTVLYFDFISNDNSFNSIKINDSGIYYGENTTYTQIYNGSNWTNDNYKTIKVTNANNVSLSQLKDYINTIKYSLPFNFDDNNTENHNYLVPVKVILSEDSEVVFSGDIYNPYNSNINGVTTTTIDDTITTTISKNGSYILRPENDNLQVTFKSIDDMAIIGKISKLNGYNTEEIDYKDLNQDYKINNEANNVINQMKELDIDNKFD